MGSFVYNSAAKARAALAGAGGQSDVRNQLEWCRIELMEWPPHPSGMPRPRHS